MAKKASKNLTPLSLTGPLDIQNATTLRSTLREQLSAEAQGFALDLAGVTACDTAGLQLLCAARKSALSAGRKWRLANPSEPVLRACSDIALSPEEIGL